ncbi:hypothetical protein [Cupriavidus sp. KK10]|uniref:hypothetical protein n=1 Tax=Cupriavidus sp. KK10 TaxID=1478019 RepID=UPI00352FF7D2
MVAAVDGAGIARVASYQIDEAQRPRRLVTLLEAFEPFPVPVSLIYVSQGQIPLKLLAFLDFAIPRLRKRLGYAHA